MRKRLTAMAPVALLASACATAPETPARVEEAVVQGEPLVLGEPWGRVQQRLHAEMGAAVAATGGDKARAGPALDAIIARYQPFFDDYAAQEQARLEALAAKAPADQRERLMGYAEESGRKARDMSGIRAFFDRTGLIGPPAPPAPPPPPLHRPPGPGAARISN